MCGVGLCDAVVESDAFDDAWQLVGAVELAPFLRSGPDQGEDHQPWSEPLDFLQE